MKNRLAISRAAMFGAAALAGVAASPANAVVVVGGDNGWEVSFDGNIHSFYINSSTDSTPRQASGGALNGVTLEALAPDQDVSRVRTGLLPTVFAFNVKSPVVNGLQAKGRFGFYPQTQANCNPNCKNTFGAQVDLREAFFDVEGSFGTISVGRTLSLFQRHNILTDMTLFGVGVHGVTKGGGTTLGRIGWGYVYPQFNSRIAYKTPNVNGFQLEVGMYDPSVIAGSGMVATITDTPRFEAEASYATKFDQGTLKFWFGGMFQDAEFTAGTVGAGNVQLGGTDVSASGFHGGVQATWGGFDFVFSGYSGSGLGLTLMLDTDSLDAQGTERDNDGFIVQGAYTFNGKTKIGVSYGESNADETNWEHARRVPGTFLPGTATVGCTTAGANCVSEASSQDAWTIGVYHDITSWLKVVAEYTNSNTEWQGGETMSTDTFAVGSFFFW
ncbi:MAG: hypothetical protein AB7Q97_17120 [Gammaproteobacteria bacterium]